MYLLTISRDLRSRRQPRPVHAEEAGFEMGWKFPEIQWKTLPDIFIITGGGGLPEGSDAP